MEHPCRVCSQPVDPEREYAYVTPGWVAHVRCMRNLPRFGAAI